MNRDLVRSTAPPLLAACVIALIVGRLDDGTPVSPAPATTVQVPQQTGPP